MATTVGTSLSRKIGSACVSTSGSECTAVTVALSRTLSHTGVHVTADQGAASRTSTAAALQSSNVTSSKCGLRRMGTIAAASFACCGVPDLFKTCGSGHQRYDLPMERNTKNQQVP